MTIIRSATQHDIPHLAELIARDAVRVKSGSTELKVDDTEIGVAEHDGHPVGFIVMRVIQRGQCVADGWLNTIGSRLHHFSNPNPDSIVQPIRIGFIEDIYVQPSLRRRSVGFELFKSSLGWFEERDINLLEAAIWIGNEASHNFFLKLGFTPKKLMIRKKL